MQGQRTGGDQRGVFAQAVAGEQRRRRATDLLPYAPAGHARREQRRLGEFGTVEGVFLAFARQCPQVDAGARGRFGERVADDRMGGRQLGEHAGKLRSLPGKDEGERSGHGLAVNNGTRMIRAMFRDCLYRGVCPLSSAAARYPR